MFTINERGRGFLRDGRPFFWLGDTAWLLFSRLTDEEIEIYLTNRALKGYTVIQASCSPDGARRRGAAKQPGYITL